MQRFVNDPDFIVDDMLTGFVKAHCSVTRSPANDRVVAVAHPVPGKVGLVTGGGSGHEPAFLGYLGAGMLDAVAVGEVFSSPPAQAFYDAIVAADTGAGVACLIGNYAGDVMNVRMAIDMAADDGIDARLVVATDDVASAPKESAGRRHGIAGGFFVWKCAGARAAEGASLDEVVATAERAVAATRSICVGLAPCTIPAVGRPNFSIEPGTMEFGVGHHGETGIRTEPMSDAGKVSGLMATTILDDAGFDGARRLAVMLSGLGGTPSMELYVLFDGVERVLAGAGHRVERAYLGDVVTSLDMNGASLTVVELDDELDRLLDAPATAVGLKLY